MPVKRSSLVLIDKKEYLWLLKEQMQEARRQSYTSKNNDLEQLFQRGKYAAYRKVIKFFEKLKSDL